MEVRVGSFVGAGRFACVCRVASKSLGRRIVVGGPFKRRSFCVQHHHVTAGASTKPGDKLHPLLWLAWRLYWESFLCCWMPSPLVPQCCLGSHGVSCHGCCASSGSVCRVGQVSVALARRALEYRLLRVAGDSPPKNPRTLCEDNNLFCLLRLWTLGWIPGVAGFGCLVDDGRFQSLGRGGME